MKIALLIAMLAGILAGCTGPAPQARGELGRYENGVVSFRAFRDESGEFHGEVMSYWPSGKLAEYSTWRHGAPVSGKSYNEAGVLVSEIKNGTGWRHCPGFSEYYSHGKYVSGRH